MTSGSMPLARLRRFWADRPLRIKGLVVIALPVLILFVALFWVGLTTREEEAAEDSVQRALEIQEDLRSREAVVYRAALSAELTPGTAQTRANIEEAALEAPRILLELSSAIQDAEQSQRLRRLDPIARQTVALLGENAVVAGARTAALDALGRELQGMRGP